MYILAIDTAGRSASVALLRDDTLLYETVCNCGLTHSETLMPMVDAALHMGGIRPADLDLFCGHRRARQLHTACASGLAAVKGMALARPDPLRRGPRRWRHRPGATPAAAR